MEFFGRCTDTPEDRDQLLIQNAGVKRLGNKHRLVKTSLTTPQTGTLGTVHQPECM